MKLHKLPTAQERERERLARLREKVREMVPESEGPLALPCWIWQGRTNEHGYGMMRWEGRSEGTHRLSYLAQNGPIPNWM